MTWLAIDTSGSVCAAALFADSPPLTALARQSDVIGRGHAERIPVQIGEILRDAGLAYGDLTGIAVITGPGSFTGVRIGVAMARGLALALDIPAYGIDGLEAMIATARKRDNPANELVVAAQDAKRGEIFARALVARADNVDDNPILPSAAYQPSDLIERLVKLASGNSIRLTGSGAPLIAEDLAAAGATLAKLPTEESIGTREAEYAIDLAGIVALTRAGRGISPPVPLYLRAPDAKPQTGKSIARQTRHDNTVANS